MPSGRYLLNVRYLEVRMMEVAARVAQVCRGLAGTIARRKPEAAAPET
jgi:hypothetical protein